MASRSNPYKDFHHDCVEASRQWAQQLPANLQWLTAERTAGLSQFETLTLPTRKTENWRYTTIAAIVQGNILQLQDSANDAVSNIPGGDFYTLNMINGRLFTHNKLFTQNKLDSTEDQSVGDEIEQDEAVELIPFATDIPEQQAFIRQHLNKTFGLGEHPFATWNASTLQDGLLIRIRSDRKPAKPICINHISHVKTVNSEQEQSFSSHTRVLVVVEAGAKATLIENFTDQKSSQKSMSNTLCELQLAANSHLTHYAINAEGSHHIHTGAVFAELQTGSQFTQHNFATGSALKRRDIQVKLLGPQAGCKLFGAYLVGGKSHLDYHTTIDHVAPHCTSEENFKGIVTDQGKAVFNGRIHIHRNASQSVAEMNNKNLLLTSSAEVNTKPELEIYTDDVKCAHGATVGQLDQAALYYFQSRGISKAEAHRMLSHAFVEVIINEIKIKPVKQLVESIATSFFDSPQEATA